MRCSIVLFIAIQPFCFGAPYISEFLASNGANLADEDGDYPDWIEIHHPDAGELDLGGYHLTDRVDNLTKWTFPAGVSLLEGGYLTVFASNKDRAVAGMNLHTDFTLNADGEYLALVAPDGVTVVHEYAPAYPPQLEDRSFGVDGSDFAFFANPTPGQANNSGTPAGPVIGEATRNPAQPSGDLVVTAHVRGLNNPVLGVTLYYRQMFESEVAVSMNDNGTAPDVTAGDGIYTATIPGSAIDAAEMTRWRFRAIDTSGAVTLDPPFPDPVDSPKYWGTVGIDPAIETNLTVVHWFMENPSLAENDYPTGNPGAPAALYYLGQFYDNVGFKKHGQSTGGFPKKSFNIDFNSDHHFEWRAGEARVSDIDLLTNWADKSKVRHVLAWEVMRESGVHGHFAFTVRVQQNGEFFSTADFVEDADETYLERAGLNPEGVLYKVYNSTLNKDAGNNAFSGVEKKTRKDEANRDEFQALIDGLDLTGSALTNYQFDNLDFPKIINMLAVNAVIRNTDMHSKNWYIYQDTGKTDEWTILPWDLDLSHGRFWRQPQAYFNNTLEFNVFVQTGGASRLVSQMYANARTRNMFYRRVRTLADRFLQPLETPVENRYYERRLGELSALIDDPTHAKSDAQLDFEKWGSWLHGGNGVQVPYTHPSNDVETMAEAITRLETQYLAPRRNYIYNNQVIGKGGQIPHKQFTTTGYEYTPLIQKGAVSKYFVPSDGSLGLSWLGFAEPFDDSAWGMGATPLGYEKGTGYEAVIATDVEAEMAANSSIYVRIPFMVDDPDAFEGLELRVQYDDGFFAVLNGSVLQSANQAPAITYDASAPGPHEADINSYEIFDVSGKLSALKPGLNLLTIQGFNESAGDEDFLLNVELYGGAEVTVDPVQPTLEIASIEVSPASGNQDEEYIEIENPFDIAIDVSDWRLDGAVDFTFQPGTVIPPNDSVYVSPDVNVFRARAESPKGGEALFVQGGYSGHLSNRGETIELIDNNGLLNQSLTYVGTPSEAQQFLRISELMYHPEPNGLAEFIELVNISPTVTLDLTGVKFTSGILFDFTGAVVRSLAPGERVLVVRDAGAFIGVYGSGHPIAGVFAESSALNNKKDTLKLEDAGNNTILEFTYLDEAPWPTEADSGYSLVLKNPAKSPDVSVAGNWRASATLGGNPGGEDARALPAAPLADADGNGLADLLDYALGNDLGFAAIPVTLEMAAQDTGAGVMTLPTLTYSEGITADLATITVYASSDLSTWIPVGDEMVEVSRVNMGDGRVKVTRFLNDPTLAGGKKYFRLVATQ
ncbi:MAG: lamin tail domain-containing protein [Verrucomicrobiaceae bacterium]